MRIDTDDREPACWRCAEEKPPLYSVIMTVVTGDDVFCGAYVVTICDDCRKELAT